MQKQNYFFLSGTLLLAFLTWYTFTKIGNEKQESIEEAFNQQTLDNKNWFSTITHSITNEEYNINLDLENKYIATNRMNQLRFEILPNTLSITNRITNNWNVQMIVQSIKNGNDICTIENIKSSKVDGNTLQFNYNNCAVQYINSENGLRQNFFIYNQPQSGSHIEIAIQVESNLNMQVNQNALYLYKNGKQQFKYSDLLAFDAHGDLLDSKMEIVGNILNIKVDAENAMYPITIDPLSTTPEWLVESNQNSGHMGFAVSAAGDVNADGFDDVIVGCLTYDNGEFDEGRAYVYLGSSTGLSTTPIWQDESDNISALFGKSVSTAGDINGDGYDDIYVAAGDYSGGESLEGKVYVYYGNATGVNAEPNWTLESNQVGAVMGFSSEGLGDTNGDGFDDIVVGVNGYDNGQEDEGVAYIFYGSAAGLNATPDVVLENNNTNCRMGHSSDAAGDVNGDGYMDVMIGGWNDCGGVVPNSGGAWIYFGGPTGVDATPDWENHGDQTDGYYGFWTHGVGDVNHDGYDDIMVGAKRYDNPETSEGKAWLYLGSATGPSTIASWTTEGNNTNAEYANQFGPAGDVNGDGYDDVVLGAHDFTNTFTKEGAAYVFLGGPTGLSITPYWTVYGGALSANIGWSCDGAGDINGDGLDDIIVGIFKYSNPEVEEGAAVVYYGKNDCTPVTAYSAIAASSTTANATFTEQPYASSYKIFAKTTSSTHVYFTTSNTFTLTGLTGGKKYKSWVIARCGLNWTQRSNTSTFITPLKSGAPNEISITYPNPATEFITISSDQIKNADCEIQIVNLNGEILKTLQTEKSDEINTIYIDISDLMSGYYLYSIQTNGNNISGNFIKR